MNVCWPRKRIANAYNSRFSSSLVFCSKPLITQRRRRRWTGFDDSMSKFLGNVSTIRPGVLGSHCGMVQTTLLPFHARLCAE